VKAHAVGLFVEDKSWGPNLRAEDVSDQDPNYFQIIQAAQELALYVVFVFIKHHQDSKNYEGVCHAKFERLSKGPWPKTQPYVFIMSLYEGFNNNQLEVINLCLNTKDHLQMKMEIKRHVYKGKDDHQAPTKHQVHKKTVSNC